MVVVVPIAAVAAAPSRPTMAESTYCVATCIVCSKTVGHARTRIIRSVPRCVFIKKTSAVFCALDVLAADTMRAANNIITQTTAEWVNYSARECFAGTMTFSS